MNDDNIINLIIIITIACAMLFLIKTSLNFFIDLSIGIFCMMAGGALFFVGFGGHSGFTDIMIYASGFMFYLGLLIFIGTFIKGIIFLIKRHKQNSSH